MSATAISLMTGEMFLLTFLRRTVTDFPYALMLTGSMLYFRMEATAI